MSPIFADLGSNRFGTGLRTGIRRESELKRA